MPYYNDGPFTLEQWNTVIDAVNDLLVDSCADIEPLEEVEDPTIWSVDDVEMVRDKLLEICPDNEFSEPLDLWTQGILDEIEVAVALGCCGCEETDLVYDWLNNPAWNWVSNPEGPGGPEDAGFHLWDAVGFFEEPLSDYGSVDWAAWIMSEQEAPYDDPIPLATGDVLLVPSGGPGWVGREYKQWQVFLDPEDTEPSTPVASGPVADGYLVIGDEEAEAAAIDLADAKKAERQATIEQAIAQVAYDLAVEDYALNPTPETEAALQAALDALLTAQENLTTATSTREAAQVVVDAAPESKAWPYSIDWRPDVSQLNLIGHGPDGFEAIHARSEEKAVYGQDRNFLNDLPDAPFTVKNTYPEFNVSGVLRLLCEWP